MNKIILSGNIVQDLKTEKTKNGNVYLRNKIAVRDNQDTNYENTYFIPFKVFGKDRIKLMKDMKKGTLISIEGKLEHKSFKNKEGDWITLTEVVVFKIEEIKYKKKDNQPTPEGFQSIDDDDLPF